ncbi:MAG TPA: sugar phosphate isomerase/epimerase [Rhodothermales bacterium]|nr:sugar phosphate isomerase/epimerase [Rhodothermales bacterium]
MSTPFHIGVITDEVSRNLEEALATSTAWGLSRFELREGEERRFPFFSADEIQLVEGVMRRGAQITAVSPGILKAHADDEATVREELENTLPRAIDMAGRFDCPLLIVFGFERYEGEPDGNRVRVLKAFEQVAEAAAEAGMIAAIENEPNFWIDRPAEIVSLLEELGHPALKINWDPANLRWGGQEPTHDDFEMLKPHIANVHVKDYTPDNPDAPWVPVGQGVLDWETILGWIIEETNLPHATMETHCVPLLEKSRESLDRIEEIVAAVQTTN